VRVAVIVVPLTKNQAFHVVTRETLGTTHGQSVSPAS
jgi:hypothetical protein